jgi:hypothetical protein
MSLANRSRTMRFTRLRTRRGTLKQSMQMARLQLGGRPGGGGAVGGAQQRRPDVFKP